MGVTIRAAAQSDIPYFYEICLKTGNNGKDASGLFSDPWLIGQYYAAPYLFHDQSHCFVAEEDRIPKGYIIGTADTTAFNIWLEETWLPPLRKRYPEILTQAQDISSNERALITTIHSRHIELTGPSWLAQYPAHLHIDLLPSLQGKGCGRMLIERLSETLKEEPCPGVHLGVSGENDGAIAFYGKTGFTELEKKEWGLVMGKRLG